MKGIKEIIAGTSFLISGVLGVAIGNLELTLNTFGEYKHSFTYLMFIFFIIIGLIYTIIGLMKKND